MANEFSLNKKTKMIAQAIYENTPYLKEAKSYMNQGQLEGKKYGRSYTIYIPGTGKVVNGLVANPEDVVEREVTVTLDNINTSVEVDAWQKLTEIEDFKNEIAKPFGRKLAKTLEKKAIDASVFKGSQAVVGTANFATLAEGAAALKEISEDDKLVSFIKPTDSAKIANGGLANFIPSDIQKDIYRSNYLGEYADASQVVENQLPIVKVPASASVPTVSATASGTDGFEAIKSVSGFDAVDGLAFKIKDDNDNYVKVVGLDGMETDQDYVVIVSKDGSIPELRITCEGKNFNNPNAWCATGAASFTLEKMLDDGAEYSIGLVRGAGALAFDTYKFNDIVGTESSTQSYGSVSMKVTEVGNGVNMTSMVRMDVPHAICLPDSREAVVMYFKK